MIWNQTTRTCSARCIGPVVASSLRLESIGAQRQRYNNPQLSTA